MAATRRPGIFERRRRHDRKPLTRISRIDANSFRKCPQMLDAGCVCPEQAAVGVWSSVVFRLSDFPVPSDPDLCPLTSDPALFGHPRFSSAVKSTMALFAYFEYFAVQKFQFSTFCFLRSVFQPKPWSNHTHLGAIFGRRGFCQAFEHMAEMRRVIIAAAGGDFIQPQIVAL